MTVTGFVVGWRIDAGVGDVLAAYGLMIAFSFAITWIGVLLGSLTATPEGVQGVAFIVIFPVTFVASTFVPTSTLPGVLRTVAEWNPTSALANALRNLFGNPGGVAPPDAAWPVAHPSPTPCSGRPGSSWSAPRSPCAPTSAPSAPRAPPAARRPAASERCEEVTIESRASWRAGLAEEPRLPLVGLAGLAYG